MPLPNHTNVQSVSDIAAIFRDGRAYSISDLATITGLARATAKQRIDELVQLGLVAADAGAISTGGRPASRFRLVQTAYVIGIDLGASHCTVGLLDLTGLIVATNRTKIKISAGPKAVLDHALTSVATLLEKEQITGTQIAAIGIGLPGPVEHATGRSISPPIMPGWHNFDVPSYVRNSYDLPVLVDNDANLAALGEMRAKWPESPVLLYLKVATGIGAGIVTHGTLQRGSQGIAGDVGHIRITRAEAAACRCGNIGCLEAVASGTAVANQLKAQGVEVDNLGEIVELAQTGDIATNQLLRAAGRAIGEVLTMCISLINPSVIVIDGQLALSGEQLLNGIREVVYAQAPPLATRDLVITRSRTHGDAALLGAGAIAIDFVLSPEYLASKI